MIHVSKWWRMFSVAVVLVAGGCSGATNHGAPSWLHDQPYAQAAVAADHIVASQAGVEMMRLGGNAVDAAVAASFTLSVVRPYSCGIGGGGFMLIHDPAGGSPGTIPLNYRETAPAAVGPAYYTDLTDPLASRFGVHAAATPGTVAGLLYALEQYGTLDRAMVMAPAIRAAQDGFAADADFLVAMEDVRERLAAHPDLRDDAMYIWTQLCHEGTLRLGDRITNPDQARALRIIARDGAAAFYEGDIADAIVSVSRLRGGPLTHDDLRGYRLESRAPLRSTFREWTILTMPPPSSGGIAMQQMFGIVDRLYGPWGAPGRDTAAYLHLLAEAMKHAFADRAQHLADDRFVDVPTERLTGGAYLDDLAARVDPQRTQNPFEYGSVQPPAEDGGTSHVSVIDSEGMAVSCTETINLRFGSLVCVPGFGFVLNNEMDDFTTTPGAPNAFGLRQSDRNLPQPGKRPLSSMSPTIVLDEHGAVRLIAGASGGPRIITATAQVILNALMFDDDPWDAVRRRRLHHQWLPDELRCEPGFQPGWPRTHEAAQLRRRGHILAEQGSLGVVQVVEIRPDGVRAASDPRKGGAPAGY